MQYFVKPENTGIYDYSHYTDISPLICTNLLRTKSQYKSVEFSAEDSIHCTSDKMLSVGQQKGHPSSTSQLCSNNNNSKTSEGPRLTWSNCGTNGPVKLKLKATMVVVVDLISINDEYHICTTHNAWELQLACILMQMVQPTSCFKRSLSFSNMYVTLSPCSMSRACFDFSSSSSTQTCTHCQCFQLYNSVHAENMYTCTFSNPIWQNIHNFDSIFIPLPIQCTVHCTSMLLMQCCQYWILAKNITQYTTQIW